MSVTEEVDMAIFYDTLFAMQRPVFLRAERKALYLRGKIARLLKRRRK